MGRSPVLGTVIALDAGRLPDRHMPPGFSLIPKVSFGCLVNLTLYASICRAQRVSLPPFARSADRRCLIKRGAGGSSSYLLVLWIPNQKRGLSPTYFGARVPHGLVVRTFCHITASMGREQISALSPFAPGMHEQMPRHFCSRLIPRVRRTFEVIADG